MEAFRQENEDANKQQSNIAQRASKTRIEVREKMNEPRALVTLEGAASVEWCWWNQAARHYRVGCGSGMVAIKGRGECGMVARG